MTTEPTADRAALRDRIAETMARADGWEWAAANFCTLSTPASDRYRRCADAVLAVLPEPADRAAVCICGHTEQQHFEDVCVTEITGCDCGDFLTGEAAREVIARWRDAAIQARADQAAVLREAEAEAERQLATVQRVRHVLELEPVLNRTALEYRGLIISALMGDEAQPTTTPEPEPTAEEIARANVLALHQIGEQLAGIESWMWEHLANVRDAAKTQPEERPRCPYCQMPHDLTPGSLPVAVCDSVRQRIAEAEQLHGEGDHSLCARVDCDALREQPAAGVRQGGAKP
ncbi:hypothetical protein ACKI1J_24340 [Streptomyces scabiei]|uniref:hypothetical protein n=1 Tax=Streptomyces TaxID=1883 RepID=UPI0038F7CF3C